MPSPIVSDRFGRRGWVCTSLLVWGKNSSLQTKLQETSGKFKELQSKHQIPSPKLQRIFRGVLNTSNS
jgi:hypothetical protein